MNRRKLREQIFKTIFTVEFHPHDTFEAGSRTYLASEGVEDSFHDSIIDKGLDLILHLDAIDEVINTCSEHWTTKRMAKVDLAILRLAVYEIQYDANIPSAVAVNEAVELAKKYGTDHSSSFVNGVLAKLMV